MGISLWFLAFPVSSVHKMAASLTNDDTTTVDTMANCDEKPPRDELGRTPLSYLFPKCEFFPPCLSLSDSLQAKQLASTKTSGRCDNIESWTWLCTSLWNGRPTPVSYFKSTPKTSFQDKWKILHGTTALRKFITVLHFVPLYLFKLFNLDYCMHFCIYL